MDIMCQGCGQRGIVDEGFFDLVPVERKEGSGCRPKEEEADLFVGGNNALDFWVHGDLGIAFFTCFSDEGAEPNPPRAAVYLTNSGLEIWFPLEAKKEAFRIAQGLKDTFNKNCVYIEEDSACKIPAKGSYGGCIKFDGASAILQLLIAFGLNLRGIQLFISEAVRTEKLLVDSEMFRELKGVMESIPWATQRFQVYRSHVIDAVKIGNPLLDLPKVD